VEPTLGVFIQRRLRHLSEFSELEVVAPYAFFKYGDQNGHKIRFGSCCPASRWDGPVFVSYPRWIYPPLAGGLLPLFLFFQMLGPLLRRRKTFPFEIIDTHFGYPDGISGAFLSLTLGVPFTMTLRGNEPMHCRSWMVGLLMKFAARRASRVFAVSERLRQFAITLGADPGTVKTIPNGVDNTLFYPRDRILCRRKHGFATDRPLIISAGALIERKGHHRVLDAVKQLMDRDIPVQLAIVGGAGPEGSYEPSIRKAVSDLGLESSVRFMGVQAPEQMSELLSAADVFCLASTREGWPNVVHEALACGTPVVATDVGAVPDMIRGPECGFVVPVNDKVALAAALERALREKWNHKAISATLSRSWRQVALEVLEEMRMVTTLEEKSCK